MIQFLAALTLFILLHSVPAVPAIRTRLVGRIGRRSYLVIYSLVSLLTLAWLFHAALRLDYVELWPPAAWQAWLAVLLVPVALLLLVAGLISPNPASISVRRGDYRPGAILAVTRHPVLWGFFLWAASHVVANGDLRSLMLFGTLGLFAVIGIFMTERRGRRHLGEAWASIEQASSIVPFAAIISGRARLKVDREMIIGFAVAAVLTVWLLAGGHAALFSADPLQMTGM